MNYDRNRQFVKKYYPESAYLVTMQFDSQYNDEGYDNRVNYLLVEDNEGNELLPNKATARECRDNWDNLAHKSTSEEPLEDIVFKMNGRNPSESDKTWDDDGYSPNDNHIYFGGVK